VTSCLVYILEEDTLSLYKHWALSPCIMVIYGYKQFMTVLRSADVEQCECDCSLNEKAHFKKYKNEPLDGSSVKANKTF
jgi:hypothetical protein